MVRTLAERLRADGVEVWFDEWVLKPGDSIPAKIEEGLERSRVLVLCMSANAFGSDWAQLESGTFRFRDPLNKERRFLPLRLDDAPIKGSLAQFLYINWLPAAREHEYVKLLEACQLVLTKPIPVILSEPRPRPTPPLVTKEPAAANEPSAAPRAHVHSNGGHEPLLYRKLRPQKEVRLEHKERTVARLRSYIGAKLSDAHFQSSQIEACAFSRDEQRVLLGSSYGTVYLSNFNDPNDFQVFEGHTKRVHCVAWSDNQRYALSGSDDGTVRVWDLEKRTCLRREKFYGHPVQSLACGTRDNILLGTGDGKLRLWNYITGECLHLLKEHTGYGVGQIVWNPDGRRAMSIGRYNDPTIRLWNLDDGKCVRVIKHKGMGRLEVLGVTWRNDGRHAISCLNSEHIGRVWDMKTGECVGKLEGHNGHLVHVLANPVTPHALTSSCDGTTRFWDLETGRCLCVIDDALNAREWTSDGQRVLCASSKGEIKGVRGSKSFEVRAIS